ILDKTNSYYFNSADDKLYKNFDGTTYSNPVSFDFEVNAEKTKVITKNHESQITLNAEHGVVNQVNIKLWYLPLTVALGDFTSNMGSQITLAELESEYGVELPKFFDNVDKANTTINEMEEEINNLYVADFMGYTIDDSNPSNVIVKNGNDEVKGIMAIVAKEKVGDLSTMKETIDNTAIEDILNLNIKYDNTAKSYYDDKDNDGLMDDGEKVANIMNTIAGTKVKELSSVINTLKVSQIFSEEERSEGVLSLITTDPTIDGIPAAIEEVIKNSTVDDLIAKKVIAKPEAYDSVKNDETLILKQDNVTKKKVFELTLPELIDYCFDLMDEAKNLGV
ncbi:MAG: hypothetical protein IKY10_05285, partial [Clostridia bacterium]|nr:hypothetical protein [Clostridia bacterium]